jgi:hypothetical protein
VAGDDLALGADQAEQAGPLLGMGDDQQPHGGRPAATGQPRNGPSAVPAGVGQTAASSGGEVGQGPGLAADSAALAMGLLDRRAGAARLEQHRRIPFHPGRWEACVRCLAPAVLAHRPGPLTSGAGCGKQNRTWLGL